MSLTEPAGTLLFKITKYRKSLVNCLTFWTNDGRSCNTDTCTCVSQYSVGMHVRTYVCTCQPVFSRHACTYIRMYMSASIQHYNYGSNIEFRHTVVVRVSYRGWETGIPPKKLYPGFLSFRRGQGGAFVCPPPPCKIFAPLGI